MSRGILLIALGSPHYGRMAANLAASIRYGDKDIDIHLVSQESALTHLSESHRALFTSISECPPDCYLKNGKEVYLKAKTYVYDLSPFDETIFLDVDLVWFGQRKISNLFTELKDVDFTMQNRGFCDLSNESLKTTFSLWCNINEVKLVYDTTGKFYHLASEFIYFKRTDKNKEYFELVKEIFENPRVKAKTFDGDIPDEMAFDIASAVLGRYPHKDNYVPIFWYAVDKSMAWSDLMREYNGYSIGGNVLPSSVRIRYEQLTKAHSVNLKLPYNFKVYAKKRWNKQRATI